MSSVILNCPSCAKEVQATPDLFGTSQNCYFCQSLINIPTQHDFVGEGNLAQPKPVEAAPVNMRQEPVKKVKPPEDEFRGHFNEIIKDEAASMRSGASIYSPLRHINKLFCLFLPTCVLIIGGIGAAVQSGGRAEIFFLIALCSVFVMLFYYVFSLLMDGADFLSRMNARDRIRFEAEVKQSINKR